MFKLKVLLPALTVLGFIVAFYHYHLGEIFSGICFTFISIGALLNLIAVWANGFKMPVLLAKDKEVCKPKTHCQMTGETRLPWLCDRFYVGNSVISAGDFICFLGITVMILSTWFNS